MPETRHAYEHVSGIYFPIAIGVFALVVGVLLVLLLHAVLRKRPPGRRHEANVAEGTYALVLVGVVVFLLWWTFHTENSEDRVIAHPGLRIVVTAAQWSWHFTYPNGKTVTAVDTWNPPAAEVPLNTEIEIVGRSRDVIHGFWVPRLRFQRQLIPGQQTRFDLIFDQAGRYLGECSVYCGLRHSQMHFVLQAVPRSAYNRWVAGSAS